VGFLITSKVLDVRRRGATTEAYGVIRRKPAPAKAGGGAIEGNAADDALMVDQDPIINHLPDNPLIKASTLRPRTS